MLLVVSPNLSVDRILEVDGFRSSVVQRSRTVCSQPGGKGSNVARVFRQLGGDVVLTGFVGQRNGFWIVDPLSAIGIQVEAIEAYAGESRTCTIICDQESGRHPTVINEETPEIYPDSATELLARVDRWLPEAEAVLVTGSLSRGLPVDFYRTILNRAREWGVLATIDATGGVLREGLHARPDILKANVEEVASALGDIGSKPQDIARSLVARGFDTPRHSIVTFGEVGALLVSDGAAYFATPPCISNANPIGTGDAFAAGFIKAFLNGSRPPDALRFATAVAASDAATIEPGSIVVSDVYGLIPATIVKEW